MSPGTQGALVLLVTLVVTYGIGWMVQRRIAERAQ